MIKLVYSNKTERLLVKLAGDIRRWRENGAAHLLEPVQLVVPNRNMETWVRLSLAQLTGIAANLRFSWLNRYLGGLIEKACPGELKLVDLDKAEAALLAVLFEKQLLELPALRPVKFYLQSSQSGGAKADLHGFDAHLAPDGEDLRRVQLAARMAFLFQEYSFSRPEMIASWRRGHETRGVGGSPGESFADPAVIDPALGSTVAWQRALWQAAFGAGGILEETPPEGGGRWLTMDQLPLEDRFFERIKEIAEPPVYIFGISYMARIFQQLFSRLGEAVDLNIYNLNPCAEFWQDVGNQRAYHLLLKEEFERREIYSTGKDDPGDPPDPFGIYAKDNPALLYWGRPGGEHLRLLGDITDYVFDDAFENPLCAGEGILQRLQLDILKRTPEEDLGGDADPAGSVYLGIPEDLDISAGSASPDCNAGLANGERPQAAGRMSIKGDDSIRLIAAPSVRREVEWVADEIWRLMRDDRRPAEEPPLRFSDLAIIVNSAERDIYLPLIEAVFASCHDLPCSISDLPGSSGSRLVEAMGLLLKFPFGRFTRSEMVSLMGHPALKENLEGLTPGDLAGLAERLGIVYGGDHRDHAGTYIEEDIFNWDQGIRRLALGAFLTGEKSGDQRIFEAAGGRWLVEEVYGDLAAASARLGLLARSLLADARFARSQKMTLGDWAKFYYSQIDTYFAGGEGTPEQERSTLRRVLAKLEDMDLGRLVSGRVAAEIALRALDSLGGGRGQYLAEGVAVSTFLPMRAIPFRVVFLLGLGEGLFPASSQGDALDLRSARRREGDVDPSERDRYMFLETLLCTRERLYLSYVCRDEHTGDPRQPSAVVQELLHTLKTGYLGPAGMEALKIAPPLKLHRSDQEYGAAGTFLDEALAEARVQGLARGWRDQLRREEEDRPGSEIERIRELLEPGQAQALSKILFLPGKPPGPGPITAAAGLARRAEEAPQEAPVSITLPLLRRFLECPMQGWATARLGLSEVQEDPAEREEEDFVINRLVETGLLSDIFYRAAAAGCGCSQLEKYYEEQLLRLRLGGKIPAGELGKIIKRRHLRILESWFSMIQKYLPAQAQGSQDGAAGSAGLHRVRLGRTSRETTAQEVLDPLILEAELPGPGGKRRSIPVRMGGLTEGLSGDRSISLTVLSRGLPRSSDKNLWAGSFRYFLRGAVALAALDALGAAGDKSRQILVLYADGQRGPAGLRLQLAPPQGEKAKKWLTALAADFLGGPHDYLLPCNAVWPVLAERSEGAAVDGWLLQSEIKKLVTNDRASFPSLWGPVPAPRTYPPPPAAEAAQMVSRRFLPLFDQITGWEVLKWA